MSTTVIDALLVTLGLDASNFKRGSEQNKRDLREVTDESKKKAKEIEEAGKRAASFFSSIKMEALSLLAVLTAGAGLKSFVTQSLDSSAAAGRLAHDIGMGTEALTAWQGAAARSGGTADDMANTLKGVSGELTKFKMGLSSDFVAWFARAGGDFSKLKDANGTVMELSRIISDLDKKDPGKALMVAKNLGVDERTFTFLRKGPKYVQDQLEAQKRLGVVTEQDAERAARMTARIEALRQSSEKLGRDLLTKAIPALEWMAAKLSDLAVFAQKHGPAVVGFFTAIAIAISIPMAEMILFAAAIAAVGVLIGYVYEEWTKWMDGGQSSLSGFFNFFSEGWKNIQAEYGGVFQALGDVIMAWVDMTVKTMKFIYALFFGTGADIRAAWKDMFSSISVYFWDMIALFGKAGPAILTGIKSALAAAFAWAKGRAAAIWAAITGQKEPDDTAPASPAAPGSTNAPAAVVSPPAASAGAAKTLPRGVRNNNPGNLNFAGQAGAEKEGGTGGRFAKFGSMEEGIAAMVKQLKLYQSRGIDTINAVVAKYAPASENDVGAYVKALSTATGKGANEKLDLDDLKTLVPLLKGIVNHENGRGYVSDDQITAGARLASSGGKKNTTTSTSTTEVKIGQMTIQTQATDAAGIARDAAQAFRQNPMVVPQANSGVN